MHICYCQGFRLSDHFPLTGVRVMQACNFIIMAAKAQSIIFNYYMFNCEQLSGLNIILILIEKMHKKQIIG